MYLDHYHLKLMPFEMGPDPRFLWLGSQHKEAFTALRNTILDSKGFIVITGGPGTGKSTLLNATAANFGNSIRFVKISDPTVDEMDFFNFVANGFEMGKTFRDKAKFLTEFQNLVKDAAAQSQKMILAIDEAHRLTAQRLEQIRVFASLETSGKKVVNCLFAGQSEFLDMVKNNQALAQQVFFSHHIQPLTQFETGEYVAHRLEVAGATGSIFTAPAVREVFRLTGGIPRLINILCDQAMLSGYTLNTTTLGPEVIKDSTSYTMMTASVHTIPAGEAPGQGAASPSAASGRPPEDSEHSDKRVAARVVRYGAAIALTVAVGLAGYSYFNGNFPATFTGGETPSGPARSDNQGADPPVFPAEIARLQNQLLEQRGQKDQAESRFRDLQEQFLAVDKERQEAVAKIVELHKQLAGGGPPPSPPSGDIESLKQENSRLQAQLLTAMEQKDLAGALLNSVAKEKAALSQNAQELKSVRDRAAQLEAETQEQDKKLSELEHKLAQQEKVLAQEKAEKDRLGGELSSRQEAIAGFQKKDETARSTQRKLEIDLENSRRDNARLQSQLQEMTAQLQAPKPTNGQPAAVRPDPAPDPAGIIEFVIKRKSQ
jgi:type II secretory pathway predicted ATPase ExeA/uncharacterized coiled-coil protein SlyX